MIFATLRKKNICLIYCEKIKRKHSKTLGKIQFFALKLLQIDKKNILHGKIILSNALKLQKQFLE